LAACLACEGAGGVPGEALHDPYTERLVTAPYPPGKPWPQVTDDHTREGTLAEWSPQSGKQERPKDVLSQRVRFGRQDTSPDDAARAELVEISKQGCFSVSAEGPTPGTEDGNDVAYAGVSCLDGSLVLLKVIRGHEALYLVRRGFSSPPSPQERRAIDAYLADQVYLCPI